MGWKLEGTIEPTLQKCVIIVVPHTSWHDFYLGPLTRGILGVEINFVAKKELFRFPFGFYFKWMGGAPLDRSGGLDKVKAIAKLFEERKTFRLAIAPEGTRKKASQWKTGFYYISLQANVPIIPVAFDWGLKTVRYHKPFYPSGNSAVDMPLLHAYFKDVKGKIPEQSFDVK